MMPVMHAPSLRSQVSAGARSRSSGVSTPNGACSTRAQAMRMPASSARSCSRLSRRSSGLAAARRKRQRRAPVGVDADMVPARPVAPRDRHPGEIQRRRDGAAAVEGAGGLHDRGSGRLLVRIDRRHQRGDIESRIGQRRQHGAQVDRRDTRQIALQVDHDVVPPLRIQFRQRRVHPVGAARQRRIGQHRDAARRAHRVGDLRIAAGHGDRADIRLPPAVQHMHDHRPAMDVGQRLARQPRGGHAGGNDDDWVH